MRELAAPFQHGHPAGIADREDHEGDRDGEDEKRVHHHALHIAWRAAISVMPLTMPRISSSGLQAPSQSVIRSHRVRWA